MPRQRFFNLPADARARLLDLAIREFAEKGFDKASLNEILSAAAISKGAYYYYFEDKEDLFATALESAIDAMLAKLRLPAFEQLAPAEFWPAVERAVGQWSAMYNSDLFKLAMYLDETRRRSPRFAAVLAKGHTLWRTLVEEGQRLGCVRTDLPNDHLVRLIEANDLVLDSMFLRRGTKVSRASFERHGHLVIDTLKRLLVVTPPASWSEIGRVKPGRRG